MKFEIFEYLGNEFSCLVDGDHRYIDIIIPPSAKSGYSFEIDGLDNGDYFLKIFDDSNNSIFFYNANNNILRITPFFFNGLLIVGSNLLNQDFKNHKWIRIISSHNFKFKKITFLSDSLSEQKVKLKINLHSGLGDCLRILSLHPSISGNGNYANIKIYYTYAALGMQNNNWGPLLISDILGRNDIFEYVSEDDFINLNAIELTNGTPPSGNLYFKDYFPNEHQGFAIPLSLIEQQEISEFLKNGNLKIGIQLSGNDPKKHYDLELRLELLRLILEKYPESQIFLFDKPNYPVDKKLLFDNRIINLVGKVSMAQTCNLIRLVDFWIAPDSYSKYIRNWEDKKQIILCTTLPYISNENMLKYCFNNVGLCSNSKVNLLGVVYDTNFESVLIVDDINLINPSEIIKYM
jgi:hypothetical protein